MSIMRIRRIWNYKKHKFMLIWVCKYYSSVVCKHRICRFHRKGCLHWDCKKDNTEVLD